MEQVENMNKQLLQFIDWLEDDDRENWEIERYVEVMLQEQQEDIKSVIRFLTGNVPREKIINFIKKYLYKN